MRPMAFEIGSSTMKNAYIDELPTKSTLIKNSSTIKMAFEIAL